MKFWVLFRAPWTGGRWVPWSKTFASAARAWLAIAEREGESPDPDIQRIVAIRDGDAYWEVPL